MAEPARLEPKPDVRMKPWENISISGNYFGVVDRGLPGPDGVRVPQGGHSMSARFDAQLAGGWHANANVNYLSSLTFQLVFSPTFNEAVNSEVNSSGFLTRNFNGFSINFSANDYKDYLNAATATTPETSIVLRNSPEVRFDSVDRSPWKRVPVYFGFDVYSDAVQRSDPGNQDAAVRDSQRVCAPGDAAAALEIVAERHAQLQLPGHALRRAGKCWRGGGFARSGARWRNLAWTCARRRWNACGSGRTPNGNTPLSQRSFINMRRA